MIPSPSDDVDTRVEELTKDVDLRAVAGILTTRRNTILASWLAVVTNQSFHQGRSDRAVADHIPPLFDALVDLLARAAHRWIDPGAPLEDPTVLAAAQSHARARFAQGLQAGDIVTEFRVLRQEIGRVLRRHLDDATRSADIIGAELLINDAIDGAIMVSLEALVRHVDEAREDFLARTVHDVRQPLTALKASLSLAARMIRKAEPNVETVGQALTRATAAADQMAVTLSTMMEASRVALGQLDLHLARQDLSELLQRVISRLDPESAQRLTLHGLAGDAIVGWWDGAALERVVSNVLVNALKYSPAGTPIDITATREGDTVCLSIRDYGRGLAAEDLDRIFERYTRVNDVQVLPGEGLGLYLARGIINGHRGRIWAESAGLSLGTTIHLRLPLRTDPTMINASDDAGADDAGADVIQV